LAVREKGTKATPLLWREKSEREVRPLLSFQEGCRRKKRESVSKPKAREEGKGRLRRRQRGKELTASTKTLWEKRDLVTGSKRREPDPTYGRKITPENGEKEVTQTRETLVPLLWRKTVRDRRGERGGT